MSPLPPPPSSSLFGVSCGHRVGLPMIECGRAMTLISSPTEWGWLYLGVLPWPLPCSFQVNSLVLDKPLGKHHSRFTTESPGELATQEMCCVIETEVKIWGSPKQQRKDCSSSWGSCALRLGTGSRSSFLSLAHTLSVCLSPGFALWLCRLCLCRVSARPLTLFDVFTVIDVRKQLGLSVGGVSDIQLSTGWWCGERGYEAIALEAGCHCLLKEGSDHHSWMV